MRTSSNRRLIRPPVQFSRLKGFMATLLLLLILQFGSGPASLALAPSSTAPISEPQPVQELLDQAFEATQSGKFGQAEDYWTAILDQFPNNPAAWSNRGNLKVSQNKLTEAIPDYNRAIELAPNVPDPYINRGIAYEGLKQWQRAIADYNRAIELDLKDADAYNNRGNAEAGSGNWLAAIEDYQKASELNPNFSLARANYALALYQSGQKDQAIRDLKNIVRKYPNFADVRAALAACLWVSGQQGQAESNWVAVIGLDARYRDLDWVRQIRRWPPAVADALESFLSLN